MLTGRGTFQKFYQQDELKSYLEEQLGTDALPAAPGVNSLTRSQTPVWESTAAKQEPCPPSSIGTRTAWLSRLQLHGLTLRGHRLIKSR